MSENCIFCQIVSAKISADVVYRDEQVTAFRDRQPAAPVHILIIPNRHIESLNEVNSANEALLGHMLSVASQLAEQLAVSSSGYRVLINTGADAGQSVSHLHLHLLGGKPLTRMTR